jgi:hypothetical protein
MTKKNNINKKRNFRIRNSTAEFLIFSYQTEGDGVEVRVQDGTIWLSQKLMGRRFDTSTDNIALHLKNIFAEKELSETATNEDFSVVQREGVRDVKRTVKHYNLDAIIAVGYRVNSKRATTFRQWTTTRTLRLHGSSSQRYRTKCTMPPMATATELIYERADADKEHMGLTSWGNSPSGKILKGDVSIGKNYLTETELGNLALLVNTYLDLAERRARSHVPMTMEDWAKHLDLILQADGNELLTDAGKISAELAKEYAENEFEKYRIVQDRLFQSDFDKELKLLEADEFTNADPVPRYTVMASAVRVDYWMFIYIKCANRLVKHRVDKVGGSMCTYCPTRNQSIKTIHDFCGTP